MAKIGTSNPDRTISLKRLQCVVENKQTLDVEENVKVVRSVTLPRSPFYRKCSDRVQNAVSSSL